MESTQEKDPDALQGAILNLPFDTYKADPGLNQSVAKIIAKRSAKHAKRALGNPPEEKPCFSFGTAAHALLLEPEIFEQTVIASPEEYPVDPLAETHFREGTLLEHPDRQPVPPKKGAVREMGGRTMQDWNPRTKWAKQWIEEKESEGFYVVGPDVTAHIREHGHPPRKPWTRAAAFCKQWEAAQKHAGKTVVARDEYDQCFRWREESRHHPAWDFLFRGKAGANEVSLFWQDPATGLRLKGRVDRNPGPGQPLVDIKTARDGSAELFGGDAARLGYAFQAAWYLDGWNLLHPDDKRERFYFWVLEKDGGTVACWKVPEDEIELCRRWKSAALKTWAACLKSGVYPGYPDVVNGKIQTYQTPKWLEYEIEGVLG